MEQKIILIPNLSAKTSVVSDEIPSWIKMTAGWWANGEISEDEFLKGLEYLVKQGIMLLAGFLRCWTGLAGYNRSLLSVDRSTFE